MQHKIFLGGLSGITTRVALEEYFNKFGSVIKIDVPKRKKNTKFSKGYGVLSIKEQSSMQKIIDIKYHRVEGRLIHCKPFLKGDKLKNQTNKTQQLRIYVSDIPLDYENSDLFQIFSKFGRVEDAYIIRELESKVSRGYGYVMFFDRESAVKAIKAQNVEVRGGSVLKIEEFKQRGQKKKLSQAEEPTQKNIVSQKSQNNTGQTASRLAKLSINETQSRDCKPTKKAYYKNGRGSAENHNALNIFFNPVQRRGRKRLFQLW